MTGNNHLAF